MTGIEQQDFGELDSGPGSVDLSSKPVSYQFRQAAAVIDVSVSQKDCRNVSGFESPGFAVELFNLFSTLKQTAVHQVLLSSFDQITGPRHATCRSQAGDLHKTSFLLSD